MLGDRFDRRIVMVCSDAAGAVVNLALVFVHAPDAADRAGRAGGGRAVAVPLGVDRRPSRTSCPAEELVWANAVRRALSNVGFMLGPIAGGVLVATVGGSYAFAFNALALAASAALAWSVVGSFNATTGEKLRGGLGAGFRSSGTTACCAGSRPPGC